MEIASQYHEAAAALIARLFLGVLFFFQGYDAIFKVKIRGVIDTYRETFADKGIPYFLLAAAVWFATTTELVGGAMLILGFYKYIALYLLGANVIVAAIGFGINTAMWDTRYVLPRLFLLLMLLALPQGWDVYTLDHFLSQ